MAAKALKWRNGNQIRGHMANLISAIRCCMNGSEITLDLSTARALVQICKQAAHTEDGHMGIDMDDDEGECA